MTCIIHYSTLNKVLLKESSDPKNYIRVMKYRLKSGKVKGEIQDHYSKSPDKFSFHTIDVDLEKATEMCVKRGCNFYEKKEFLGMPII